MDETYHTPTRQHSGYSELRAMMDAVPTDYILTSMPRGERGPAGHPKLPLWRAHLYGYLTGAKHTNDVIRQLRADPALRELCGFTGPLPCRRTFNRFNARLTHADYMVELETYWLAHDIRETGALPGFGEKLAVDSTNVPTHARPHGPNPADSSDSEAHWDS